MRCLEIGTFRAIGDEAVHKLIVLATQVEEASKTNRKTRAWSERPTSKLPPRRVTPDQLPSVLQGPLVVWHVACGLPTDYGSLPFTYLLAFNLQCLV